MTDTYDEQIEAILSRDLPALKRLFPISNEDLKEPSIWPYLCWTRSGSDPSSLFAYLPESYTPDRQRYCATQLARELRMFSPSHPDPLGIRESAIPSRVDTRWNPTREQLEAIRDVQRRARR